MGEIIIKASAIVKEYKLPAETIRAVDNVDFIVKRGDFVSIMGPSGSGKTTFLDIIGCLDSISSGVLEIFGRDVSNFSEKQLVGIRRARFGFVFQEFLLVPTLTAIENLELAVFLSRQTIVKKDLVRILERVGLGKRINHFPRELSGGECQRVAVARALAAKPEILIADEPTGNLDSKNSQEIFSLFLSLNTDENLTTVVATHDRNLGSQAKKSLLLKDGKIDQ